MRQGLRSTIDKPVNLRGDGGPVAKKRRFSNGAMAVLTIPTKVGAANVMENSDEDE